MGEFVSVQGFRDHIDSHDYGDIHFVRQEDGRIIMQCSTHPSVKTWGFLDRYVGDIIDDNN